MAAQPTLKIQTLRIVCFALIGGLVMITVAAVLLRTQGVAATAPALGPGLPLGVAFAFATSVVVHLLLRQKLLREAAKSKIEARQMLNDGLVPHALGAATIVGAALFEGPGLLGAIAVILGGPWYCIAAPALGIMAIAWMVPSRERFEEALRTADG